MSFLFNPFSGRFDITLSASEILTKILTVDGAGTGLDSDLLDGQHGSYYAPLTSLSSYVLKAGDTMTGALLFIDNTIDIGASGATRPRTIYVGTSIINPLLIGGTSTTADLTLQTTSGVGTTGADMHFLVGNNGATEAITILNTGNVGIGTTNPDAKLRVAGNLTIEATWKTAWNKPAPGAFNNIFWNTDNPTTSMYWAIQTAGYGLGQCASLYISTGDQSDYILLQPAGVGKVGIGTVAPTAKLHIVGSSDTQQLIVKANVTQTANLTEFQNSSATVLASISGTGVTTAPNFVSSVATGTQPIAVTSTTVNTNLNSDLLDGQHGAYYAPASGINGSFTTVDLKTITVVNGVITAIV